MEAPPANLAPRRGGGHAEGRINLGHVGSIGRGRISGRDCAGGDGAGRRNISVALVVVAAAGR